MKRFKKYILIFFSPILILALSSEILLRKIPNDYLYKKEYLDRNSKNISILFLGSSHAFFGINPEYIKSNSFNAAEVSQTLDLDLKILKKYDNKWDSLKYIVIPIDYFSLYSKLEKGIEAWRIKNYNLYYGMNISGNLAWYTEIFSNNIKVSFNKIYSYYIRGKSNISCSNSGWEFDYNNSKNKNDLNASGKNAAERHTAKDDQYFKENVNSLKLIIEFAREKKIKVLLFTFPAYKSYVQNLEKKQLNRTINTVTNLADSCQNTIYVNMLNDKSFNEEDYFDADHLNEIGAKKLTLKIDSIIKNKPSQWR